MSIAIETEPSSPDSARNGRMPAKVRFTHPLFIACVLYVPAAVVMTVLARHQVSCDSVSYLRLVRYYAAGQFDLAVSGYWGPLMCWLLVPLQRLGADMVLAGHAFVAVSGGLFILASWWLAQELEVNGIGRRIVPIAAALLSLTWLGYGVLADPLFTSLLTLYCASSWRMARSARARDAVACGLLAGLSYFAKYYALPVFLLHHTLVACLFCRPASSRRLASGLRCWLLGVAGFALVAGPWIGVLTARYHRFTFATTGTAVHSQAGPNVPPGDYWPQYRLMTPREGRIATWENPDEFTVPWPSWSPLAGVSGLVHQARLVVRNVGELLRCVFHFDKLGLLYIAMLMLPVLACIPRAGLSGEDSLPWRWLLLSVACYLSGLMLVFAGTRRYYWPLTGLLLASLLLILNRAVSLCADGQIGSIRGRLVSAFLAACVLASCAVPAGHRMREVARRPGEGLKQAAAQMRAAGVRGPLAANSWHGLLPVGYWMEQPCVGVPLPGTSQEVVDQLRRAHARAFLLFEDNPWPVGAAALTPVIEEALGKPRCVLDGKDGRIRVYDVEQAAEAATHPAI